MSDKKQIFFDVQTPIFRGAFVQVQEPQPPMGQSKEEATASNKMQYSVTMLFPDGADLTGMQAAYDKAVAAKWGTKLPKGLVPPFRDGTETNDVREEDGKKRLDGFDGTVQTRASRYHISPESGNLNGPPSLTIYNADTGTDDLCLDSSDMYSGAHYIAKLTLVAYDVAGKKGVKMILKKLCKVRDDEKFGGVADEGFNFDNIDVPLGA